MKTGMNINSVALLWDESFLWGLMSYKALKAIGLPFNLIRSDDIREGMLKNYKMLFVPGGWASNKINALDVDGVREIKRFVNNGGNYLGFCGGAGLATTDGIGLLNIKRKPTKERVPSFSGRIHLNMNDHPVWNGLFEDIFHAWWPSQFLIEDKGIKILATYGDALPDSFSSDLNIGDVEANPFLSDWSRLEGIYKIKLDPKRLKNEPAIIEGLFGKGKVMLSLIHFDTPGDVYGYAVLGNLWKYLAGTDEPIRKFTAPLNHEPQTQNSELAHELETAVSELIRFGERNFLWFWRNPMLLQWRRGIRGLEYCTLYMMIKEVAEIIKNKNTEINMDKNLGKIKELLLPFVEKASHLLILERYAMLKGNITYEKCDDPEIIKIRTELFSNTKSHGGMFKNLIANIDDVLRTLLINS